VATSPQSARVDPPQVRRFGGFEFDPQTGIISRNGSKTRLQGQLLELLLRQPGAIVTREDIRQHLWPDGTVVEFEHSVNAAVKRLRAALEDDADHPTFIETIPRRGYRFIAPVEDGALPPFSAEPPAPPTATARQRRNQPLLVLSTLAALLVLIAAWAGWHAYSVRHRLTGNDVILVASFLNKTGDPVFDDSLDKALEVKLTESPVLSVLPEADVRATMRTMRLDPDGPVTPEVAIEVCKRQGLKAVVVPRIAAIGGEYLITLEAIDAQNQKTIAQAQAEAQSKEKVIAALGHAASHLRTQLGESSSSLEKYDAPLDLATTSSLEALQAYRKGQALYRAGKRHEAVAFFERAVELDPQFCSAFSMLGSVYHSVGDNEAARENFAQAF
jgi:DNA-binding winged helix-turn-helix (wHTH) protein